MSNRNARFTGMLLDIRDEQPATRPTAERLAGALAAHVARRGWSPSAVIVSSRMTNAPDEVDGVPVITSPDLPYESWVVMAQQI